MSLSTIEDMLDLRIYRKGYRDALLASTAPLCCCCSCCCCSEKPE